LTEHEAQVLVTLIDTSVRAAGIQIVESAALALAKINGLTWIEPASEPEVQPEAKVKEAT
jgi:hypothetical protein